MKTNVAYCGWARLLFLAAAFLCWSAVGQNVYTPYTFITFAGAPGINASNNGVGNAARFNGPGGVAVDVSNNVYVADQHSSTIRKITPDGMVTTIAGTSNSASSSFQDGTNAVARFSSPSGVAADTAGNVYVTDKQQRNP